MTAASKSAQLSDSDKQLIQKALDEIRIGSEAKWGVGGCVMLKVNKFDSFGKAGIKEQDELIGLNGAPLVDEFQFVLALGKAGVGAKVTLRVRRAGQVLDVPVELLKKRKLNFEIDEAQVDLERKIAPA